MSTHYEESPQHLKLVSRVKHIILQNYLPAWERILGSWHNRICYFDCYAGPGIYELEGKVVDGSPIIAVKTAKEYLSRNKKKEMNLFLVENDEEQYASLENELEKVKPYGTGLGVNLILDDAKEVVTDLLDEVSNLAPTFFLVDPYGHPLTVPLLNKILARGQTEALITFMYYRINMDAGNSVQQHRLDEMFGDDDWRKQPFINKRGIEREREFLDYFMGRIEAKFKREFRIRFDVEDNVKGNRTKYYLIHACNHIKAALTMKDIMWPLGDEEGLFDFSGVKHGRLFSDSPTEDELRKALIEKYKGKVIGFDQIREDTWRFPFITKQYRSVIKQMKSGGLVTTTAVTSKTDRGLQGADKVRFL